MSLPVPSENIIETYVFWEYKERRLKRSIQFNISVLSQLLPSLTTGTAFIKHGIFCSRSIITVHQTKGLHVEKLFHFHAVTLKGVQFTFFKIV